MGETSDPSSLCRQDGPSLASKRGRHCQPGAIGGLWPLLPSRAATGEQGPAEGAFHKTGQREVMVARFVTTQSREPAGSPELGLGSQDVRSAVHLCAYITIYGASIFPLVKWHLARLRLTWNEKMLQRLCGPHITAGT